MRLRQLEIILYDEKLVDKLKEWNNDKHNLVVFYHCKEDKKPHYHCYLKSENQMYLDSFTKLGINENMIQKVKNWKTALCYGLHLTDNSKYQYTEDIVVYTNVPIDDLRSIWNKYQTNKDNAESIKDGLYKYGNLEITKSDLFKNYLNDSKIYSRYDKLYKQMREYRTMKVGKRDMRVIYITGGSGTGKTTFAKYLAEQQHYDFFVSGSGKDILDGYDKEECIILDDLRGDVFTKAELFKFLDNNTNSSVKSRYANKDISNCKMIIITSVKTPYDLYDWSSDSFSECPEQFYRRLQHTYVRIDRNTGFIIGVKMIENGKNDEFCYPLTMADVFKFFEINVDSNSNIDFLKGILSFQGSNVPF